MKRYWIAFLLACVVGTMQIKADAEEINTAPMFGIRAAFDVNIPGNWHYDDGSVKMFRQGCGFTLGGVYNVYLGKGFYLEPGVSFFYDTYAYDDVSFINSEGLPDEYLSPSLYKLGLRVPMVIGYTFDISDGFALSVYTGPELSWAVGGKIRLKDTALADEVSDILFGDFQRRVDCAWKVGFGVPYNQFLISIDAAFGMTDLLKNPNVSFRENRVSVGLTYYL